ncbi:hypothetical protein OB955_21810 [Halobacteria archaeon AArc-m2/3/4]|uniref:TRAM domain-containing protein n=1 Tax=Natronoglomus mannanivorans TaxID=2979990 RepID=A0ABT2QK95_9EURY|nr:hypothetical protein [Halobacteria archaeon AArc-m2/3/4]
MTTVDFEAEEGDQFIADVELHEGEEVSIEVHHNGDFAFGEVVETEARVTGTIESDGNYTKSGRKPTTSVVG